MMKTRIYTLLAALLLTAASTTAQTKIATTISVAVNNGIVAGDDACVTVSLTDANNNGVTGIATISVTQGEKTTDYNVAVVEGTSTYYVNNLADASYTITASYAGDDVYAASQTAEAYSLYISKIATSLDISIDKTEMHVSETAKVSIQLNKSINAVVTLAVDDKEAINVYQPAYFNANVALVNGKGSFDISSLEAGTYYIKVVYSGDDKYNTSTSNILTLTVSKRATTISVNDITAIKAGEDAIVNVTATPSSVPSCTVTVDGTDYTVALVNGAGSCIIPNLAEGDYEVTASIGDDKYAVSTSGDAKTLTVNAGSPIVESNAVATVTVTPAINTIAQVKMGNVTYNVPVVSGTGTLTLPQQVAGTYTVSAALSEDGKYLASTSDETQLVSVPGITFPFAANQTWATWCDDWAWAKPAGVTAYTISAVNGNTVTISEVSGDNIPSHTPLLLKKTSDAVTPTKVITGTGTDDLVSTTPTGATFYGNASDTKITTGYSYAIGQSYGLYNGEFVLIDTDNGIAANRCMLTLGGNTGAPKLSISTDVTGVEEVVKMGVESGVKMDDSWYTLDGRKLEGMPTKKGIYINNGIKVVIK